MRFNASRLVLFVMLDHFLNNEIQEFLGKLGVLMGQRCKLGQPCDLRLFAGRIGWRKVMFSLKHTYGLGVLKAFTQCVDEDRVKAIDAFAVPCKQGRGAGFISYLMCGTFGALGRG